MYTHFTHIRQLFVKLGLILFLYSLCRILFGVYYFSVWNQHVFSEVLLAYFHGIRFDITAIIYTNSLFILLILFPAELRNNKHYALFTRIVFVITNSMAILFNLIDIGYFGFSGKRSGMELFHLSNEWSGQLSAYLKDYWFLCFVLFLIVYSLTKFSKYPQIKQPVSKKGNKLFQAVNFIILIGFFGVMARGSFGVKPLNTLDASRLAKTELSALVLNTPFCMIMTIGQQGVDPIDWIDDAEAEKLYTTIHQFKNVSKNGKNIVLIIVESLGKEYVGLYNNGKGYTPFLDSLSNHSLVYRNAYANGKRSIDCIPAIVASMPSWMDNDYINSYYKNNILKSTGSHLQEIGYDVSFYHGGKNGTMSFDNFIAVTESGKYYGMDEYPNPGDFDGNWGIFDEPYLAYFCNELSLKKSPFFATVFTLSSHHPYNIPSKLAGKLESGTHPIHKSIRYTDYALAQFFEAAKKTDWYQHTLFVITADHSAINELPEYQSSEGMFKIPLLFFDPSNPKPDNLFQTVQQIDIMPTLLEFAGYNKPFFSFGKSMNDTEGFAVQYVNNGYQFVQYPNVLMFDGSHSVFKMDTTQINVSKTKWKMEQKLKAVVQMYHNKLIHNKTRVTTE